jgi:hypothetical protein
LALVLHDVIPKAVTTQATVAVPGAGLVWIRAVPQHVRAVGREVEGRRQRVAGLLVEVLRNGGVV